MGLFNTEEEMAKARQELKERDDATHERNRLKMIEGETMSNLSDRDIQVQMLKAIKSTNGWIIFIGVVTLISVIGAVITVVNLNI